MLSRVLTRKEQAVLLAVAAALLVGSATVFLRRSELPRPVVQAQAEAEPAVPAPPPPPEPPTPPVAAPGAPVAGFVSTEPEPAPAVAVVVDVRGAIETPGVYEVPADTRIEDLLTEAGGATDDADLSDINLVANLIDRSTLVIPFGSRRELIEETLVLRRGQRAADLNPPQYTISGSRRLGGQHPAPPTSTDSAAAAGASSSGLIDINFASQQDLESLPGIGPHLASEIVSYRSHTAFSKPEDIMNVSGIGEKRFDSIKGLITVGGG